MVRRVATMVTPGESMDVLVTDHGIAVNPKRPEVEQRLRDAHLPVMTIEELHQRAVALTGEPEPLEFTERIVGSCPLSRRQRDRRRPAGQELMQHAAVDSQSTRRSAGREGSACGSPGRCGCQIATASGVDHHGDARSGQGRLASTTADGGSASGDGCGDQSQPLASAFA